MPIHCSHASRAHHARAHSGITCKRCGHESAILEPFLDLQLSINEPTAPVVSKSGPPPQVCVCVRVYARHLVPRT